MQLKALLTFTILSAALTSGALANPSKPESVGAYYVCPNGLGASKYIFEFMGKNVDNGSLTWGESLAAKHRIKLRAHIVSIKQEVIIRKSGKKDDINSAQKVVKHLLYNNVRVPTSYKSKSYEIENNNSADISINTYLTNGEGKGIMIRNGQDEIHTQDGNILYTRGRFSTPATMEGGGIADFCDNTDNATIRRRIVERKRVLTDANKTISRDSLPEMYYITDIHVRIQKIRSANTESLL